MYPLIRRYLRRVDVLYLALCVLCSALSVVVLVSLGYSQSEAALAVSKIDASLPVEEIIKLALRGMAGRR